MNLTIPIRAQSSTSSWSRQLRRHYSTKPYTGYAPKNIKADRKRYVFSMITAMFLTGALVVGSMGGILNVASARSNNGFNNLNRNSNSSSNSNSSTNSNKSNSSTSNTSKSNTSTSSSTPSKTTNSNPATPAKTTTTTTPAKTVVPPPSPAQTAPATPVATTTPAPTQTVTQAPAATATPQIVAQPAAAQEPKPVDTAPQIASMTAAQAADVAKATDTVSYTSARISNETRDRILMLAGVAAITGGLLYTISLIGSTPTPRREIPIRYIVPVREGIAR